MQIDLPDIQTTYDGFNELAKLNQQLSNVSFEKIEINMSHVKWLEANMCAPLGAILYQASRRLNSIELTNLNDNLKKTLVRNSFLNSYGHERITDLFDTSIEYKRFDLKDEQAFNAYIASSFKAKNIPKMSPQLSKHFLSSIFELFNNAVIHSKTSLGIFSCGQVFFKKNRLDFTLSDLGIGIRENIYQKLQLDLSPEEAIIWAVKMGNTTRRGKIPGGLGLKLLYKFITKNCGRMQIVSDRAYWELVDGNARTKMIDYPFPGTTVNIEINTADDSYYCFQSEKNNF